jgi:hypothetical protein
MTATKHGSQFSGQHEPHEKLLEAFSEMALQPALLLCGLFNRCHFGKTWTEVCSPFLLEQFHRIDTRI